MKPRYEKETQEFARKGNRALVTIDIDRRFVPKDGKRGGRMTLQAHIGAKTEKKLAQLFYEILRQHGGE